jgi:hypothetical protein
MGVKSWLLADGEDSIVQAYFEDLKNEDRYGGKKTVVDLAFVEWPKEEALPSYEKGKRAPLVVRVGIYGGGAKGTLEAQGNFRGRGGFSVKLLYEKAKIGLRDAIALKGGPDMAWTPLSSWSKAAPTISGCQVREINREPKTGSVEIVFDAWPTSDPYIFIPPES